MCDNERKDQPCRTSAEKPEEEKNCPEEVFDGLLSFFAQVDAQENEPDDSV